jgi:hypothetical protein
LRRILPYIPLGFPSNLSAFDAEDIEARSAQRTFIVREIGDQIPARKVVRTDGLVPHKNRRSSFAVDWFIDSKNCERLMASPAVSLDGMEPNFRAMKFHVRITVASDNGRREVQRLSRIPVLMQHRSHFGSFVAPLWKYSEN